MKALSRRAGVIAGALALLVGVPAVPALAHVTANPNEATSPYFRTTLRVGHGCGESPTTAVRVQIPEGAMSARGEVVPGWDYEFTMEELEEPIEGGHGETVTERVAEIAWVGGTLSNDQFQEFGVTFRVADDAPEVLWLPTIQECEDGEHRWIEIPPSVEEWGDVDEPAPYVINSVGGGGASDGSDGSDASDASDEAEADGTAATEGGEAAASDEGGSGLAVVALIAALLGVALGAGALILTLRRPGSPTA